MWYTVEGRAPPHYEIHPCFAKRPRIYLGYVVCAVSAYRIDCGIFIQDTLMVQSIHLTSLRTPPCPPPTQVFVRGGMLLIVADSPERALLLYCKHPNASTLHPCPYCLVDQVGTDGGNLGDRLYDILANRRTRGQILRARRELAGLASRPTAQAEKSKELGVVAPDKNQPVWPLHDIPRIDALKACPVESLHACALVRLLC